MKVILTYVLPPAILATLLLVLVLVGAISRFAYQALAIIFVILGFIGIVLSIGDGKPLYRWGAAILLAGMLMLIINV